MLSFQDTINEKAREIHAANAKMGFWDANECNFAERCMLIVTEISEAVEADRKDLMDSHIPTRRGIEVELADAVIRILDLAGGLNLDLGGAIEAKLKYNEGRPFKHGKKY
jgi:NTP pyrophosphatase (non-canonical NTP hydrolase)